MVPAVDAGAAELESRSDANGDGWSWWDTTAFVTEQLGELHARRIFFMNSTGLKVVRIKEVNAEGTFIRRLHNGSSDTFLSVEGWCCNGDS